MNPRRTLIRFLLVPSLLISLGTSGLCPQVWSSGGTVVVSQPSGSSPRRCCCQRIGNCRCGMACCVSRPLPAKEQAPVPNRDNDSNGRCGPWVVALAKCSGSPGAVGDGWPIGRRSAAASFSLAESTLQAHHIRLNA